MLVVLAQYSISEPEIGGFTMIIRLISVQLALEWPTGTELGKDKNVPILVSTKSYLAGHF